MGFQLFGRGRGISRGRAVCSSQFRRFTLDIVVLTFVWILRRRRRR